MKYLKILFDIVYMLLFISPNTVQVTILHNFLISISKMPPIEDKQDIFEAQMYLHEKYSTEIHVVSMLYYFTLAMILL